MRTASTCFVAFWLTLCSAWGQESDKAEDVRQGHQLAVMLCAKCHLAAPDQRLTPDLNPRAVVFINSSTKGYRCRFTEKVSDHNT